MPQQNQTVTFAAPPEYQRAINAFAALHGINRSQALRTLLKDALVQHHLLSEDAPIQRKIGRPTKNKD